MSVKESSISESLGLITVLTLDFYRDNGRSSFLVEFFIFVNTSIFSVNEELSVVMFYFTLSTKYVILG